MKHEEKNIGFAVNAHDICHAIYTMCVQQNVNMPLCPPQACQQSANNAAPSSAKGTNKGTFARATLAVWWGASTGCCVMSLSQDRIPPSLALPPSAPSGLSSVLPRRQLPCK